MISFKEFLVEARMAPLYHATRASSAKQIIDFDILKRGDEYEPGIDKRTISLTRNFTFARNWVNEIGSYDGGIIFQLDQQKISSRYKIIPYNFFGFEGFGKIRARYIPTQKTYSKGKDFEFKNQFEEAVMSDIKEFHKYITKIFYDKEHSFITRYAEYYNIPTEKITL